MKCRRLEFKIRAVILSKMRFPHLCFKSVGMAPCPPRSRTFLDKTVEAIALFSVNNFVDHDDKCMLSVPLSTSGQSGGICQVLSTGAFTLFFRDVHGFTENVSPSLSL